MYYAKSSLFGFFIAFASQRPTQYNFFPFILGLINEYLNKLQLLIYFSPFLKFRVTLGTLVL